MIKEGQQVESQQKQRMKAVANIIDVFGAQHKLGSAIGVHQSTVALWHTKGDIPHRNHQNIIDASERLFNDDDGAKVTRIITHRDFFDLPSGQAYKKFAEQELESKGATA